MVAGDGAHHNLLRPEALEAMFVLWRVTAKPKYRDWAWAMFQAFERHCKARPLGLIRAGALACRLWCSQAMRDGTRSLPLAVPLHVFGQACNWVGTGSASKLRSPGVGCWNPVCAHF